MKLRLVIAVCVIMAAADIGFAQWIRYRDPRIPRTADGQPDLNAPAPASPTAESTCRECGSRIRRPPSERRLSDKRLARILSSG